MTNWASNNVSVINTATNTVTATVVVGANPTGVAITPNGDYAYVANYSPNNVSVIDTATNIVTATVTVGSAPFSVAITPNGDYAYVTSFSAYNVSVIDTATNAVAATITGFTGPFAVAITPNGDYAYVTNAGSNSVSVIDTVFTASQSISAAATPTSTSWANTSTLSSSGYSGTGAVSYHLDAGTNGHTSSAVCSLSGTTLSASGPGTCYAYASIAADANYTAATSADVTVTFTMASQSISAAATPTSTSWANTSTLSSSGYSGTGAVSYHLDAGTNGHTSSAVCSLSGTTLSASGPGTCYAYASIAADANYTAATSADVTVTFTMASQSISAAATPTSTSWANTSTLSSSGYSGTGAVSYHLDAGTNGHTSSAVCSLSGTTLSASGPGTCYAYASIAADANYSSATSADVTVTFTAASQSITFVNHPPTVAPYGGSFTVEGTSTSGLPVVFSAAAMSVCTVGPLTVASGISEATVTFTGVGTCTVLANQSGSTDYLQAPELSAGIMVDPAPTTLVANPVGIVPSLLSLSVTFSGTLTSQTTGKGIAGQKVTFSDGPLATCSATTNANGEASCTVSVLAAVALLLSPSYSASYQGDSDYVGSSAIGKASLL